MDSTLPSYSIFLPVSNGGDYLPICVESILAQTYKNFELLIFENQSSDGTAEWLQTLEGKDERIKVIPSKVPLTIENNWRRILDFPKKKFMLIIGHDDLLEPFFLEEINCLIHEEPRANLYLTHFRLIDSKGKLIRNCAPITKYETSSEFLASRMAEIRDSYGTGYVMRSKNYDQVGGIPLFRELLFADDALWISLMRSSFKLTSPRICFSYRKHLGSVSYDVNPRIFFQAMEQFLGFLSILAKEDGGIQQVIQNYVPQYVSKFGQNYYWYLKLHSWRQTFNQNEVFELEKVLEKFAPNTILNKSCLGFSRWLCKKLVIWAAHISLKLI